MKIFTKYFLLLCLLLSPVSLLDAQTLAERLDELMKEYNSKGIFNGSILIADSSGIVLEKGYGFADLDEKYREYCPDAVPDRLGHEAIRRYGDNAA